MTHELGPALRTTTVHEAWVVGKGYDGNAPDGPVFATCANEQLAAEVRTLIARHDENNGENDHEHDENADENEHGVFWPDVSWPFVDGCEHAAAWRVTKTEATREQIATTLAEAIAQFA